MTDDAIYFQLRERLGNPDKNEVNNRQLLSYVADALDWVADQLKYRVVTDKTTLAIQAGVQELFLPEELAWTIWVEWNTHRLTPASTYKWDRDGIDWRGAPAGQPREYAIQGRKLVLYPTPDAATVAAQPFLTYRYIAAAAALSGSGPIELSELDQWIAIYKAAILYLKAHPTETAEAMIQGYQAELDERLPRAKRRLGNPIRDYRAHLHVNVGRFGGAR